MPEALRDAEEAIKIDPKFVKAYIRKALTQQAMKEHTKALETLQKATEIDVEKKVRTECLALAPRLTRSTRESWSKTCRTS